MDWPREFLTDLKATGQVKDNFLGLLNVLIGRRIEKSDGTLVCNGLTWRQTAALLKKVRWQKEAAQQLGIDPQRLPPRDREKYWYAAIAQGRVDSDEARKAGDLLAGALGPAGYIIGPAPQVQAVKPTT